VEGNQIVLTRLEEVGKMVEALVKCQLHMAETGRADCIEVCTVLVNNGIRTGVGMDYR